VGGGQVADIGRYLAAAWNQEAVCIPTVISTDAFLVDSTGLRTGGCVKYVKSKVADLVILDKELLGRTPRRYHSSGCGDVLSIFTGLFDWRYANDRGKAPDRELYDSGVAIMAEGILAGLLSETEEIKTATEAGLAAIVNALAMEVQLCNLYGNSRPEEGGEHFFAYCIENKLPHFLHGEMVAFGVLLTGYLQGQDITEIKRFMDEVGLNYKPDGLNRTIVVETLKELPDYVIKHSLRYSVYHNFQYRGRQKQVEEFFNAVGLKE
jgi:glycerol-1-phosphate dehydrogenase [NAD(P)+]